MSDIAIRVENLSKLYHIGAAQKRHDTLRDAIVGAFNVRTFERSNVETLWALRDVFLSACPEHSRRIKRGEVVGLIGRSPAPGDPPGPMLIVSVVIVLVLLASGLIFFRNTERTFADVV